MSMNTPKLKYGQRGLVLLIFAILISLVSITLYFNSLSVTDLKNEQKKSSSKIMENAKKALLAYVITYSDTNAGEYGFLPCPDVNDLGAIGEGGSHSNCGSTGKNAMGLFPWASLETGLMRVGAGNCLWYAVSGDYKSSPKQKMLNEDTNGTFRLYRQYDENGDGNPDEVLIAGSQPQDRPVALIIDPGRPLGAQSREFMNGSVCGLDYDATHFMEGNGNIDNSVLTNVADAIDDFIHAEVDSDQLISPLNDRIVYITRDELWQAVLTRTDFSEKMQNLTSALAGCLAAYANITTSPNRRLTWPAPYYFAGADYRDDLNYSDVNGAGFYAGRFPINIDDSNILMSIADGVDIFDIPGLCNNIAVPNPPNNVDLTDTNGEYRKLWENWKDHYFYVLSKAYEPGTTGESDCSMADCIKVGGNYYAGAVIFSGTRLAGQSRSAPPLGGDPDDKAVVANYLEDGRSNIFPSGYGNDNLNSVNAGSNDIMFCITNESAGIGSLLNTNPC